jgi:hypothetical protein
MHAKKICSEFLDIFKNDFRPAGAYAPMRQSGFPPILPFSSLISLNSVCKYKTEKDRTSSILRLLGAVHDTF